MKKFYFLILCLSMSLHAMHFDWEAHNKENKEKIETYFNRYINGQSANKEKEEVLPFLEEEWGTLVDEITGDLARPLVNVDIWISNLFELSDNEEKANELIIFLLNNVCEPFHPPQAALFMQNALGEHYAKKPQVLQQKLSRWRIVLKTIKDFHED